MRAHTRMDDGAIGEPLTGKRRYSESANVVNGSLASRTPILGTSAGSDFSRISKSSKPTVEGTKWRERRHRERGRRCCRDAPCVGDAAGISAFDMRHGAEGW